jgi:hypothetical protein
MTTYTLKLTASVNGQKRISYLGADGMVTRLEKAKDFYFKDQAQAMAANCRATAKAEGIKVRVDVIRALSPMQKCWRGLDRMSAATRQEVA